MRMFLCLRMYVFLSIALLFIIGAAKGQLDRLEILADGLEDGYDIGDAAEVIFFGVPEANLNVSWVGVEVTEILGPGEIIGPYVSGLTYTLDVTGILVVRCKIISSGAFIYAYWEEGRTGIWREFTVAGSVVVSPLGTNAAETVIGSSTTIVVNPPDPQFPLRVGDTFTQTIEIHDIVDLTGWQIDIAFNPKVLRVVDISEGNFLEQNGEDALFLVENSPGKISVKQVRMDKFIATRYGISGSGVLVVLQFSVLSPSEALLGLHNVRLSNSSGERLSYSVILTPVVATHATAAPEDVNQDGVVDILDLVAAASSIGSVQPNLRADVNDDGIIDILDLVMIVGSANWGQNVPIVQFREPNAAAPTGRVLNLMPETIAEWIALAKIRNDGSLIFQRGIVNLENFLAASVPSETRLLLNYPNPFNPETWIPYQLSAAADVKVSIYSVNGVLVRTLTLGHQAAGVYQSKGRAAYWDGRNDFGERVASGLYFYTLTAGDFSATRKMLIRK